MERRIFVFGSNTSGAHGAGAAYYAHKMCGARQGDSEGLTGDAYAIPTCEIVGKTVKPLPIPRIQLHVNTFREFAHQHGEMDFLVTAVGCGIAGYQPGQIADLFRGMPDNVYLQARLAYGL